MKHYEDIEYINILMPDNTLSKELHEFVHAIDEKCNNAAEIDNKYLVSILKKIKASMLEIVNAHDSSQLAFKEAYEEITHLYVFTEIYLEISPEEIDIDFI